MKLIKKLALFSTAFVLVACTEAKLFIVNAQAGLSGAHSLKAGIAYGKAERQKLDIYVPKNVAENAPVIIFFYGGGWQSGSKSQYEFAAEAFTSNGYIVVIPDYAKYPEFIYPTFLEDAALATKWVTANINKYGGDKNKLFLMGHSAGGHMAAMLAANAQYLGLSHSQIKGLVGLSGPYDFVPQEQKYKDMFAPAYKNGNYKSGMPATYVDGTQPPMLLIYGKKDDVVAMVNLTSMQTAVAKKGGKLEVKIYDDMDHIDTVAGLSLLKRNDDMLDRILKFMETHSK